MEQGDSEFSPTSNHVLIHLERGNKEHCWILARLSGIIKEPVSKQPTLLTQQGLLLLATLLIDVRLQDRVEIVEFLSWIAFSDDALSQIAQPKIFPLKLPSCKISRPFSHLPWLYPLYILLWCSALQGISRYEQKRTDGRQMT